MGLKILTPTSSRDYTAAKVTCQEKQKRKPTEKKNNNPKQTSLLSFYKQESASEEHSKCICTTKTLKEPMDYFPTHSPFPFSYYYQ